MPFGMYDQPSFVAPPRQPEYAVNPAPQPRRPAPAPMPTPRPVERPREVEVVRVSLPGPDELGITLREGFELPPPDALGIDPK